MKKLHFTSKKDGKEYEIEIPETSKDIENDDFISIDGELRMVEEIFPDDYNRSDLWDKVRKEGELVYGIDDYDIYYYDGEFYEFNWDTASGCIFSKLTKEEHEL